MDRYKEFAQEEASKPFEGGLVVFLGSCGNPDFNQDPNRPLYGAAKNCLAPVNSLNEASMLCRKFIDENELGGGNWLGGFVFSATTGESVAHVSYNGRIWDRKVISVADLAVVLQGRSGTGETMMLKEVLRLAKKQAPAVYECLTKLVVAAQTINDAAVPAKRPRPKG